MSIIFQLFRAEDLMHLASYQIEKLAQEVVDAMETNPQVLNEVKTRAYDVYNQLTPEDIPDIPTPDVLPNPAGKPQGMLFRLFEDEALDRLDGRQLNILEWAIICDLTHNPSALVVMRERLYGLFTQYTGMNRADIIGSDAFYQHIP